MAGKLVGMKSAAWLLALAGTCMVTGCGSSGGGGTAAPATTTVTGTVADGYLQGANVFLDKNGNKAKDAGEPSATTDANGVYQMKDVLPADVAAYPVVVDVPPTAIDKDTGAAVGGAGYVLSSPPGKPEFISPVTTLVHSQIESNPALSVAAAESAVKAQLGVSSAVSLFDDFVQKKTASDDFDRIHKVAQVVASAMNENMGAIKAAAPDVKLEEVIRVVVSEVVKQLTTIATSVPPAGTALTPESRTTLVSTVISSAPKTTEEITQAVAQASAPVAVSTFEAVMKGDGFYWIEGHTYSQTAMEYEYGNVKLGSTPGSLAEASYNYVGGSWTPSQDNYQDYYLTSSGWVLTDDGADSGTITLNADNTVTWAHKVTGNKMTVSVAKMDVSGKPIAPFVGPEGVRVATDALFPVGSEAYRLTMTPLQDEYRLWAGGTGSNQVTYYDQQAGPKAVTTLVELLNVFADGTNNRLWFSSRLTGQFTGSGTSGGVKFFSYNYQMGQEPTYMPLTLTGTWESKMVMGQNVLVVKIPFDYMVKHTDDEPNRNVMYAVHEGVVKQGSVHYGNVPDVERGYNFNKTAFDAILAKFAPAGGASAPLTAKR